MSELEPSLHSPPQQPAPIPPTKIGLSTVYMVSLAIGIVGIVSFALFGAVGRQVTCVDSLDHKAKAEMKSLEMAIKAYQIEYNRLPSLESSPPLADNTEGYSTTSERGRSIIAILMGKDASKNPREVCFYDPPPSKESGRGYTETGGLRDFWGSQGYIIIFDYDGDKKVADPEHSGVSIPATALVYSAGPDGKYETWADNIASWK